MGTVTENGVATELDVEMDGSFGGGMTRRIMRSLPFEDGLVASFRQLGADGEFSISRISVTGQEDYTTSDGDTVRVWTVVEVEDSQPDYTYYVDVETRELLRTTFEPQPGVLVEIVAP